jgi:hypothetical protein
MGNVFTHPAHQLTVHTGPTLPSKSQKMMMMMMTMKKA